MNRFFEKLSRIEFVVTFACTGRCRHCSEGEHSSSGIHIDGVVGASLVRELSSKYKIQSVMTFGGEPLLCPDEVFKIQEAARDVHVPERHVITNGYFSRDEKRIREVAYGLFECGVTKIMLSVDAFHQETIPLEYVKLFAKEASDAGVLVKIHPAWLVSKDDENPYNIRTKGLLSEFADMGIAESSGNIVFPEGNALRYLSKYFDKNVKCENPYKENPLDIRTVSVSPDGSTLGGNIYKDGILDIIDNYRA